MRFGTLVRISILGGILLLALSTQASADDSPIPGLVPSDYDTVMSEAFMRAHPDLQYRLRGLGALQRGDGRQAETYFRMAARNADKMSQAFLAQMLWDGRGIAQDRALAYAWMDLAAERGTPPLIVERERYWAALDAAERERAIREGKAIYAEYGDEVAQPRLETTMRLAQKEQVGGRTSNRTSAVELCVGDWRIADSHFVCKKSVSADRFYQDRYWKPANYWQWQEQQMRVPQEQIRVGSPTTIDKES